MCGWLFVYVMISWDIKMFYLKKWFWLLYILIHNYHNTFYFNNISCRIYLNMPSHVLHKNIVRQLLLAFVCSREKAILPFKSLGDWFYEPQITVNHLCNLTQPYYILNNNIKSLSLWFISVTQKLSRYFDCKVTRVTINSYMKRYIYKMVGFTRLWLQRKTYCGYIQLVS